MSTSTPLPPLAQHVANVFQQLHLCPKNILVGLSGGGDSIALAHALHLLTQRNILQASLYLAHLFHPLTPNETADKQFMVFCQQWANQYNLPLITQTTSIWKKSPRQQANEQQARKVRYQFLTKTAKRLKCEIVAVAHHKNDQIETVLFHLLRGSGPQTLQGMPLLRPIAKGEKILLLRPLLNVEKSQILHHLRQHNLPYLQDPLNQDLHFDRNKIRHQILPFLAKFQPKIQQRIWNLSLLMKEIADFLQQHLPPLQHHLQKDPFGATLLPIHNFLQLHPAIQNLTLMHILDQLHFPSTQITQHHIQQLRSKIQQTTQNPHPFHYTLSKHLCATSEGPYVAFYSPQSPPQWPPKILPQPGHYTLSQNLTLTLQTCSTPPQPQHSQTGKQETLDMNHVHFPLLARQRQPGDRFQPLGMQQSKKLKEILINKKIPRRLRDHLCVLEDKKGNILFVENVGICHQARLQNSTSQAIQLQIQRHPLQPSTKNWEKNIQK
ncbi:MAG: tRNA lysidine(34) synthetase TilS [Planctomycetota bacterium]|nr:MAG: tRNA lysidine(34) synthetase TilS [Planctomycetota bacterium]